MPALHHFISAWQTAPALPVAIRLFAACEIGDTILVAGGHPASTSCYLYYPADGVWFPTGNLPGTTYYTAGCAHETAAFVIGGYNAGAAIATCYKYDPVAQTWATDTALPVATYGHTATMIGGTLIVVGGVAPTARTANCYVSGPGISPLAWSPITPLPVATYYHAACRLADERLMVIGGTTSATTAACYILDGKRSAWTPAAPMPAARRFHQATLLADGRVFVSGGVDSASVGCADCYIYDPATNSWIITAPLQAALSQHGQVMIGTDLMVIGGYVGTARQSTCYSRADQQVLFTHRPRPDHIERAWLQDSDTTTAGLPIAQLPYAKTRTIPFTWNNMPKADKDRLLGFFDAMLGMATEFNAVSHDGTFSLGRFGQPELAFNERSTDVFSITVPFLEITP